MPVLNWMGQHPYLTVILAYMFFQSFVWVGCEFARSLRKAKVITKVASNGQKTV
jgi:hypothetical protein